MIRSKLAAFISIGLFPLVASLGCTRERVVVVHDPAPAQPAPGPAPAAGQAGEEEGAVEGKEVEVDDPPAEQAETPPPSPGAEYIWIKGHWRWAGRWEWRPGHWEVIRRGHEWVPGHWEHRRGRHWAWIPGHWRKI